MSMACRWRFSSTLLPSLSFRHRWIYCGEIHREKRSKSSQLTSTLGVNSHAVPSRFQEGWIVLLLKVPILTPGLNWILWVGLSVQAPEIQAPSYRRFLPAGATLYLFLSPRLSVEPIMSSSYMIVLIAPAPS